MSVEENKTVLRRVFEIINTGDLSSAGDLIADDVVDHEVPPSLPRGLTGWKQYVGMMRTAFPDLELVAEDTIAEADKVVCRFTLRGTHRGEFMGHPPAGRRVSISGVDIGRFAGGKGVEHWARMDQLGLLQQLGVIEADPALEAPVRT